jgi:hypothetical protein
VKDITVNVEIGHISGGNQIIGPNGTIHQHGPADDRLVAATAALFAAITRHRGDLADAERVRTTALAVREEAASPHPAKARLLALLGDLAVAAGDVGAVLGAAQTVAGIAQTLT